MKTTDSTMKKTMIINMHKGDAQIQPIAIINQEMMGSDKGGQDTKGMKTGCSKMRTLTMKRIHSRQISILFSLTSKLKSRLLTQHVFRLNLSIL